jgi:hypothetical protein
MSIKSITKVIHRLGFIGLHYGFGVGDSEGLWCTLYRIPKAYLYNYITMYLYIIELGYQAHNLGIA